MMHYQGFPWFWIVGGLFQLLLFIGLLVLIIAGIMALIRSARRHDYMDRNAGSHMSAMTPSRSSAALDILQERYARGEIDKEQYDQIKKDLTSG